MDNISLEEIEENFYSDEINDCIKAMDNINPNEVMCSTDDTEWMTIYERNFIINMAYKLGIVVGKSQSVAIDNIDYPRLISGEIKKHLYCNKQIKELYRKLRNKDCKDDELTVFPDFLIHESMSMDSSVKGQHLIIEAKSSDSIRYEDFGWDFLKLNLYINNLGFNTAIYLIIGKSETWILEHIKWYLNLENAFIVSKEDLIKLFFIVKESISAKTKVYRLKKLRDYYAKEVYY